MKTIKITEENLNNIYFALNDALFLLKGKDNNDLSTQVEDARESVLDAYKIISNMR